MRNLTDTQLNYIKSQFYSSVKDKTLYAIADGIQDDDIYGKLIFPGAKYLALIDDSVFGYKISAPPFLIELLEKTESFWQSYTEYLISHQLGKHTTIFFQSSLDLQALYSMFQDYIYPFGDKKRFLRFYDPRVFPKWVKSLNLEEIQELFSMADCFWYELQEEETIVYFSPADNEKGWQESMIDYSESAIMAGNNDLSNE